jgi:hypothetical protein
MTKKLLFLVLCLVIIPFAFSSPLTLQYSLQVVKSDGLEDALFHTIDIQKIDDNNYIVYAYINKTFVAELDKIKQASLDSKSDKKEADKQECEEKIITSISLIESHEKEPTYTKERTIGDVKNGTQETVAEYYYSCEDIYDIYKEEIDTKRIPFYINGELHSYMNLETSAERFTIYVNDIKKGQEIKIGKNSIALALIQNSVVYYGLDEISGTTVTNAVSGVFTGTANNARVFTSQITGVINTSADFTQGQDYINMGAFINIHTNTTGTLAMWVQDKAGDAVFKHYFFSRPSNSANDRLYIVSEGNDFKYGIGSFAANTLLANRNLDQWYHIVLTWDSGSYTAYLDGIPINSGSYTTSSGSRVNNDYIGTSSTNTIQAINGYVDEFAYFNIKLNSTEVNYLYNLQKDNNLPCAQYPEFDCNLPFNFTIGARDFYNQSTIPSFNANISYLNRNFILFSENGLITTTRNLFISNSTNATVGEYNYYNFTPYQNQILDSFNATLEYSGSGVNSSIGLPVSCFNQNPIQIRKFTPGIGFSRTLSCFNYNTQLWEELTPPSNIIDFDFYGLLQNPTFPDTITISYSAPNYFNRIITGVPTSVNYVGDLFPFGILDLQIRNATTNAIITQQVNLSVEYGNTQNTYTTTNGTVRIQNLILNQNYDIFLRSAGLSNNQYNFIYTSNVPNPYIMYMNTGLTEVTFSIRDTSTQSINNANIQIEAFVNGTYQLFSSKNTDISGVATFLVKEGNNHRVTISKDGYITQQFITSFPEISYAIVLQDAIVLDFTGEAGGISYGYAPQQTTLNPNVTQVFSWTVSSSTSELLQYEINIYNGTTLLAQQIGNNPSGSTISLNFDTTPFNNSMIVVIYSYTKQNYTVYSLPIAYFIKPIQFDDTLFEFNEWMKDNVSLRDRIIIWSVIMLALVLIFSLFGNGLTTVLIAALLSPIIAWIVGLSAIIIGFMSLLLILAVLANQRGNIQ